MDATAFRLGACGRRGEASDGDTAPAMRKGRGASAAARAALLIRLGLRAWDAVAAGRSRQAPPERWPTAGEGVRPDRRRGSARPAEGLYMWPQWQRLRRGVAKRDGRGVGPIDGPAHRVFRPNPRHILAPCWSVGHCAPPVSVTHGGFTREDSCSRFCLLRLVIRRRASHEAGGHHDTGVQTTGASITAAASRAGGCGAGVHDGRRRARRGRAWQWWGMAGGA